MTHNAEISQGTVEDSNENMCQATFLLGEPPVAIQEPFVPAFKS